MTMIFKTKIPQTEICGLFNVACEQALLFGRVKQVSQERACPNRKACSQAIFNDLWRLRVLNLNLNHKNDKK